MEKFQSGRVPNVPYFKDTLPSKNNTSGIKGVYWHEISNKWRAAIQAFGEKIELGYFEDIEEAKEVIKKAREEFNSIEDVERFKSENISDHKGRKIDVPYFQNDKPSKNNKSGIKGVYWHKKDQRWISVLYVHGKKIQVGSFRNISDAEEAIKKARDRY